MIPFTRAALWKQRGAPRVHEDMSNYIWSSSGASTTSGTSLQPLASAPSACSTDGDGNVIDPSIFVHAPPSFVPLNAMPQNVQIACDYFDDAPAPSTDMQETILQQNMKLKDCGQLLVKWRKQAEVQDDDPAPRSTRVIKDLK